VARRILLLNTDLEIGGTPTVVRELAWRLQEWEGAHVEVVGLAKEGPLREQLWARGVKCTALGARGARDFPRTLWRLWRLVRQEKIDTVVSFLMHANTMAAALRFLYPRARYIQSIQTTQPWPRWHWIMQRWAAKSADAVMGPSAAVADVAKRWAGVSQFAVIPNAVNIKEFAENQSSRRQEKAGDAEKPGRLIRIGFIGRLDRVKRVPDLVQAVGRMEPWVQLEIHGEGPDRGRIEAEIQRLGIWERARLHGAIARPQEALAEMDVLVLPSEAEGFGLVLIEAMAAGVPVVATDVPGIREVVRNEITGLLVPVNSPGALAAAITRVMGEAGLRERLVAAGKDEVRRRFSWEGVWKGYVRVLDMSSRGER